MIAFLIINIINTFSYKKQDFLTAKLKPVFIQWLVLKNNSLVSITHTCLYFYPSFLVRAEKRGAYESQTKVNCF